MRSQKINEGNVQKKANYEPFMKVTCLYDTDLAIKSSVSMLSVNCIFY